MSDSQVLHEVHKTIIDPVGVISEVLSNLSDSRDIIRELLSNASAKEVKASKVDIRIFESEYGLSFVVEDNGIGMNYTKDERNPGRLDKFLNIAQGKQAGFGSDEFGTKGFGTILLYNSREVEVETWDGGEFAYRIVMSNPRDSILNEKKLAIPMIYSIPSKNNPLVKKGTKITVKGWDNKSSITKDYQQNEIERYLKYYTVIGYTKPLDEREAQLPKFTLYMKGNKIELQPGFNYIKTSLNQENQSTVIFEPIEIIKNTSGNQILKINLKGGVTTESKYNQLSENTGGVWVSVNGIPYLRLPTNQWSRRINLTDDFVRFVVECDDLRLNLSRSDIAADEKYELLKDSLDEAFSRIKQDNKYQTFYMNRKKEFRIKLQKYMSDTKDKFIAPEKRYVWYKDRQLIGEPESEQDVAALLWILEGIKGAPFYNFQTLQYPGYQKGIDLLINMQETEESQKLLCIYAELERFFSNLVRHQHDISQMTCAFVWEVDKNKVNIGKINKTSKNWKYSYQLSDSHIDVYEIKSFPEILVGTKEEHDQSIK